MSKAVKDDGQNNDDENGPKTDADHLLQLTQSASGWNEEEAALPGVWVLAAAEQREKHNVSAFQSRHAPTCACGGEAYRNLLLNVCEIQCLTCRQACRCLGVTCTPPRWHSSFHLHFDMVFASVRLEASPCCLQRERERDLTINQWPTL